MEQLDWILWWIVVLRAKLVNHKMHKVYSNFKPCSFKSSIKMLNNYNLRNLNLIRRVDSLNYQEKCSHSLVIYWMRNFPYSFSLTGSHSKFAFIIRLDITSIKDKSWQVKSFRSLENWNTCLMQRDLKCPLIQERSTKRYKKTTGMISCLCAQKGIPIS